MGFCPKLMVREKIMTCLILAAVNLQKNIISDHKLKVTLNPVMERHKCSMVADKSSGNMSRLESIYNDVTLFFIHIDLKQCQINLSTEYIQNELGGGYVVCRRLISGVKIYFQQVPVKVDCFPFKALRFKTTSTKASLLSASFCLTSLQQT